MTDGSYVERNAQERERLRALLERLSDEDLTRRVNESWTVAAVLAHAIPPRDAARLALRLAEDTDGRVAALAPELVDEIEAALRRSG